LADFGLSKKIGVEDEPDSGNISETMSQTEISTEELQSRRSRLSLLPGHHNTLRVDQSNVGKLFRRTMKLTNTNIKSIFNDQHQDGGPTSIPNTRADREKENWLKRPSVLEKSGGKVRSINTKGLTRDANDRGGFRDLSAHDKKDYRRIVAYSVVGSPAYMSPEVTSGLQEQGNTTGYGTEVDWWSLGCVFWEMLLGVPPIQGDTPTEIFESINSWSSILPGLLEQYQSYMTLECFDLLSGFLCDAKLRRGTDLNYFKQHQYFKNNSILDWDNLTEMTPPFDPLTQPHNLEGEDG